MESFYCCAYCSLSIAKELSLNDPEKYFLMRLVHDAGKVMLFKAVSEATHRQDSVDMSELMSNIEIVYTNIGCILLQS